MYDRERFMHTRDNVNVCLERFIHTRDKCKCMPGEVYTHQK